MSIYMCSTYIFRLTKKCTCSTYFFFWLLQNRRSFLLFFPFHRHECFNFSTTTFQFTRQSYGFRAWLPYCRISLSHSLTLFIIIEIYVPSHQTAPPTPVLLLFIVQRTSNTIIIENVTIFNGTLLFSIKINGYCIVATACRHLL